MANYLYIGHMQRTTALRQAMQKLSVQVQTRPASFDNCTAHASATESRTKAFHTEHLLYTDWQAGAALLHMLQRRSKCVLKPCDDAVPVSLESNPISKVNDPTAAVLVSSTSSSL